MARQKGDGKGRLGGRVAGVPNKVSTEAKQILADIINENADEVRRRLEMIVDPKDFIYLYLKICEYVLPKKAAVNITETQKQNDLKEELAQLAAKVVNKQT